MEKEKYCQKNFFFFFFIETLFKWIVNQYPQEPVTLFLIDVK